MKEITATVKGMMCGMCESHMNDVIRKKFDVKKVTSSHKKNQTVILATEDISDEALREAIAETGYTFEGATHVDYVAKGLFGKKK